jgi:hypothetical protein
MCLNFEHYGKRKGEKYLRIWQFLINSQEADMHWYYHIYLNLTMWQNFQNKQVEAYWTSEPNYTT